MGKNIKKRTRCNSPIKCWLSSDTSPLHPCDWLWLACGWERARGSAGQTRRVFQTGADVAIILSAGALIQSKSKHMLRASRVWQMGHREQGWVSIMKPRGGNRNRDQRCAAEKDNATCLDDWWNQEYHSCCPQQVSQRDSVCWRSGYSEEITCKPSRTNRGGFEQHTINSPKFAYLKYISIHNTNINI